jgi:hypothetical protein
LYKIPTRHSVLIFVFCLLCLSPGLSAAGTVVTLPGTPLDSLELLDLGIDPNLFLLTGNTMFDYNGTYELDIIGANFDPSLLASLTGLPVEEILIIFGDSGGGSSSDGTQNPSATPEPSTLFLCLAGGLVLFACQRRVQLKKISHG